MGDGRVLDSTTLVVSGTKIAQVGGTVPADATRVNLTGKTVMPMLIDTHQQFSFWEFGYGGRGCGIVPARV